MSTGTGDSAEKKAKVSLARGATPAEIQAAKLNKLLANPSKEIHLPIPPKEGGATKTLRAPREMMKNVQGSSAGAGSGEFHVYKQSRRREYERLKIMDEEEEYERTTREALERQRANELAAEEKTAKNRLKRQRAKEARSKGKGKPAAAGSSAGAAGGADGGEWEGGEKKRKLAAGGAAAFTFKSAEDREAAEGDEGEGEEDEGKKAKPTFVLREDQELRRAAQEEEATAAPAKEAGIVIQDDD
ncbi:hypothetical protein JCM8547_004361 [Rhodosporidiobolus lusitaniae]